MAHLYKQPKQVKLSPPTGFSLSQLVTYYLDQVKAVAEKREQERVRIQRDYWSQILEGNATAMFGQAADTGVEDKHAILAKIEESLELLRRAAIACVTVEELNEILEKFATMNHGLTLPTAEIQRLTDDIISMQISDLFLQLMATKDRESFDRTMAYYIEYYGLNLGQYAAEINSILVTLERDWERKGEYKFRFDGKEVEWTRGIYVGNGRWIVRVERNVKSTTCASIQYHQRLDEGAYVIEDDLEAAIWLLANMNALSVGHACFLDPSRPKTFFKERIK